MKSMIGSLNSNSADGEQLIVEQKNIMNIFKLVVKDLMDSSHLNNRSIDKQSSNFLQFFIIFENILNHGLKVKKGFGFNFNQKDFSKLQELIALKCDSNACLDSIKDLNEIKTPLGKIRAWVKLSLMQKKLSDNFSLLISQKDFIKEFYESNALMMSDESPIIAGLLIGLNSFDVSIDLKSDVMNLDMTLRPIDYSLYLREKIKVDHDDSIDDENLINDLRISEVFDQKNFLEEINNRLQSQMEQLQNKYHVTEKTNTILTDKCNELQALTSKLTCDLDEANAEKQRLQSEFKLKAELANQDLKVEREAFQNSKTGLDQMYMDLKKSLSEETKLRVNLESELQVQENIKIELESALKLMENSLTDKNELVSKLRDQLEQAKKSNFELIEKYQQNDLILSKQTQELSEVKNHLQTLENEKTDQEKRLSGLNSSLKQKDDVIKTLGETLKKSIDKIEDLEKDVNIEKNWRINLHEEVQSKNQQLEETMRKLDTSNEIVSNYTILQSEYNSLKEKYVELETTLEELGSKLGNSHLKMEDFKEVTKQIHEFQWENDELVHNCKICTKDFNVARRKHHCRRCGGIFCNDCSDNKLPLPSSSKPVRVCNICYDSMIKKCTPK